MFLHPWRKKVDIPRKNRSSQNYTLEGGGNLIESGQERGKKSNG